MIETILLLLLAQPPQAPPLRLPPPQAPPVKDIFSGLAPAMPVFKAKPTLPLAIVASPGPQPEKAICSVSHSYKQDGQQVTSNGTGSVIGPRQSDGSWLVLTAAHCVPQKGGIVETVIAGADVQTSVVAKADNADVAWLVTSRKDLDLPYAILSARPLEHGARLWHRGLGIDRPGNLERGQILRNLLADKKLYLFDRPETVFSEVSTDSGDSGAALFCDRTNEVVAVISGGMMLGGVRVTVAPSCVAASKCRPGR